MISHRLYIIFLILLSATVLSCGSANQDKNSKQDTRNKQSTMKAFADESELLTYLKESFASSVVGHSFAYLDDVRTISGGEGSADSNGSRQFTNTNIQEAGVDESDKIKTDGTILYIAGLQTVRIVELLSGGGMKEVAEYDVGKNIDSLHLYKSILVVLYRSYGEGCFAKGESASERSIISPCGSYTHQSGVLLLDVSDPASPVHIRNMIYEGELVSSRRINGTLRLINRFRPPLPPLEYYYDENRERLEDVVDRNLAALKDTPLDQLVPFYNLLDTDGAVVASDVLVPVEDFLRPTEAEGAGLVVIITLDLDNPLNIHGAVGAVLNARHVYASSSSLYLASELWDYSITEDSSDGVVSSSIHKFDITAARPLYSGSGTVRGFVLDQFSLDEHNDILRVATSTWHWNGNNGSNNVYCLEEVDNRLRIIGRVENLAPGERLYSARFMDERGFLVTFVQIDPLFTLDLSNPSEPVLLGELKVPGYSEYIHPLGENHLLTIGKDAVPFGSGALYQGLTLSVFDVADLANPLLLHKEDIGDRGTESDALYTHKAFTYWAEKGYLAIPVHLYEHETKQDDPWQRGEYKRSELYVYNLTKADGFTLQGLVPVSSGETYPTHPWIRGLFVDDLAYAITPDIVNAVRIDGIEEAVTSW